MIAADASTWIAFLEGEAAPDTDLLDQALRNRQLLVVLVVLTELLSDPKLPVQVARTLGDVPGWRPEAEIGSELELCERKFWRSDPELAWATH